MLISIEQFLRVGFKNVLLHKMRAVLTVLGIIFGVCSVIAMLAVGEGASWEAQEQIKQLGSRNIILRSVKPPEDQGSTTTRARAIEYGLTYADARRMAETIPTIETLASARYVREDVWYGTRQVQARIVGTIPSFIHLSRLPLAKGRFICDLDEVEGRNIAVIDSGVARALFPTEAPLGKSIKIAGDHYRVVGVLGERTGAAPLAEASRDIFIPLSAARKRFGENLVRMSTGSFEIERVQLHEIIAQVKTVDLVPETAEAIRHLLKLYHKKADFEAIVPLDLLRQAERTKRIFDIVLGSIAAISLLVGGIGIMNIMLATVTERTREIGIRRALGAKKRDIIAQFLAETVVLSGGGGLLGLIFGLILPFLIERFAKMRTIVTIKSLVLAFSISVLIGIVFGLYPARRAADMDPIEALRHE